MTQPTGECLDCSLSLLIHAESKAGKSTLTSTAPFPILVLDAEGSWRFINESGFKSGIKLRKIKWDPLAGPPPRYDGTWDACMVNVNRWDQLVAVLQWLQQAQHDFRSLTLDSISEAQRRLKQNIERSGMLSDYRQWGELLVKMDALIRGYRDLVLIPGTSLQTVTFVAETRLIDGKWRPNMQGQINTQLPYWVDVVGYLYVEKVADADGKLTRRVNRLQIGPNDAILTGERVQGMLPDIITNPRIDEMLRTVFNTTTEEVEIA